MMNDEKQGGKMTKKMVKNKNCDKLKNGRK